MALIGRMRRAKRLPTGLLTGPTTGLRTGLRTGLAPSLPTRPAGTRPTYRRSMRPRRLRRAPPPPRRPNSPQIKPPLLRSRQLRSPRRLSSRRCRHAEILLLRQPRLPRSSLSPLPRCSLSNRSAGFSPRRRLTACTSRMRGGRTRFAWARACVRSTSTPRTGRRSRICSAITTRPPHRSQHTSQVRRMASRSSTMATRAAVEALRTRRDGARRWCCAVTRCMPRWSSSHSRSTPHAITDSR